MPANASIFLVALCYAFSVLDLRANTLVFTEYSSSLLTATLDGKEYGTVIYVEPGSWRWMASNTPVPWHVDFTLQETAWADPSAPASGQTANLLSLNLEAMGFEDIRIESNAPLPPQLPLLSNGGIQVSGLTIAGTWNYKWGNPPPWSETYDLQYIDLTAPVPDRTPTALLLMMAGAALAVLGRGDGEILNRWVVG